MTARLAIGARVHERGWPNMVGTITGESPAQDGWWFIAWDSPNRATSRPEADLVLIEAAS